MEREGFHGGGSGSGGFGGDHKPVDVAKLIAQMFFILFLFIIVFLIASLIIQITELHKNVNNSKVMLWSNIGALILFLGVTCVTGYFAFKKK